MNEKIPEESYEKARLALIERTKFYINKVNERVSQLLLNWFDETVAAFLIKSNKDSQDILDSVKNKSDDEESFKTVDFVVKKTVLELNVRFDMLNQIREITIDRNDKLTEYIDRRIDKLDSDADGFIDILNYYPDETLTEDELVSQVEDKIDDWIQKFIDIESKVAPEEIVEFRKKLQQKEQVRLKQDKRLKDNLKKNMI